MLDGVRSGKYLLGDLIEPKKYKKFTLDNTGQINEVEYSVSGRKIPLNTIRKKLYDDHQKLGIMRDIKDHQVKRHLLLWADHSSLLNAGYLLFTVRVIYSSKMFFTDEEMFERTQKHYDVQSMVETPTLYIFGSTKDSLAEKLSYTETRLEDIKQLEIPLNVDGNEVFDIMRIFLGIYILN